MIWKKNPNSNINFDKIMIPYNNTTFTFLEIFTYLHLVLHAAFLWPPNHSEKKNKLVLFYFLLLINYNVLYHNNKTVLMSKSTEHVSGSMCERVATCISVYMFVYYLAK